MAYRVITDDVPLSTSLNRLTHFGERLYFRLLSQTDSWGRLPGELVKLRDLCIPRLAVTDSELAAALEELVLAGRIALYCDDGTWACQIVDFDRHQPIANLKRGRSRWPAPPQTPTASGHSTGHSDTAPTGNGDAKPLQNHRSAIQITEDRKEESLGSSYVPLHAGLPENDSGGRASEVAPDERLHFGKFDLEKISRTLRGADAGTAYAIASVLTKPTRLPEAALATALEGLDSRRGRQGLNPIRNEARWLVGTLSTMRSEGQYASSGRRSA